VEYERDGYLTMRTCIMNHMAFPPPELPLDVSEAGANVPISLRIAFACATPACVGAGVLSTSAAEAQILVPVFFCAAVVCGILAVPRLKLIIGVDGITVMRRKYPYSRIGSIEASLFTAVVGKYTPRLTLDVGESRPLVIMTKGLAIDSLTLQHAIVWALARAPK
jgi:hypothetical protein